MTARLLPRLCLLLALLMAAGAASGCRHRSSRRTTVVDGATIFTTDSFPGAPVQHANVADDQRGMSPSGDGFSGSLRVVHNGDRGPIMVAYRGASGIGYAHYYDGEEWTPPVTLKAVDADLGSLQISDLCVAFLNTGNHPSDEAQERDGDAILVWQAVDIASGGGDGENMCLYATYFNASARQDPALHYGFQEYATRISTLRDGAFPPFSEDAYVFGLASDGLCGEARWSDLGASYRWGDDTTGLAAFWLQIEDNDPAVAGMQQDRYLAAVSWDFGQAGDPELPLVPGPEVRVPTLGFGASDSGVSSEETLVTPRMISYNETVFYLLSSRADAGSTAGHTPVGEGSWPFLSAGVDTTVQALTFNLAAATAFPPAALVLSTPSSAVGEMIQSAAEFSSHGGMFAGDFQTSLHSVYGADEGLARTAIYTLTLAADDDATFGEITADGRWILSEIDPATGALSDIAAVDLEDTDITDTSYPDFSSRIARNGDAIWAAWPKPVDLAPGGPSADDHFALWAAQYLPVRLDDDGLPPATIPPLAGRIGAALRVSPDITGGFSASSGFQFQAGLGYVCGVQSDPDVMSLFFEHSGGADDVMHHTRLTADLDPAGGITPTAVTTPFETYENGTWFILTFSDDTPFGFAAADAGQDGHVVVFYVNDVDPGAALDWRLFAERTGPGGGVVEIGSATAAHQVSSVSDTLRLAVTPPGSEIGTFDPVTGDDDASRAHPASDVHVFFHESKFHEGDGFDPAIRTRLYRAGDSDLAFAEAFVPPVGAAFAPPFQLDLPIGWNAAFTPYVPIPMVSDGTVGVFFHDQDRVYYQECSPDGDELGWQNDGGAPAPYLVDDDASESVFLYYGHFTRSCGCDTLRGAVVAWSRNFGGSAVNRLHLRVRDAE